MSQQNVCQDCGRRHNCKDIYARLGSDKGSATTLKAVVAFLLPLVVFIVSLAAFEKILGNPAAATGLRTLLSCLLALAVTVAITFVARLLSVRTRGQKQGGNS